MNSHGSITQWLEQVKQGDSLAVQTVWNRYYHRLIGLARKKLQDTPRRVADEDDVVAAAFDSFLRGVAEGAPCVPRAVLRFRPVRLQLASHERELGHRREAPVRKLRRAHERPRDAPVRTGRVGTGKCGAA